MIKGISFIIHQMSSDSEMPVVYAQINMQNDAVYLILNNTMAGEHSNQRTQTPLLERHGQAISWLKMSFLRHQEILKKRDVTFRTMMFINHLLAGMK